MRLDKLISHATAFTRSQAKLTIKKGNITVNDEVITNPAQKIDEDAQVSYMGVAIKTPQPRYIMLNKPEGVVCANKDHQHRTIFDSLFLPHIETLHVAGRLDIDTTGLVLITDDGQWLHRITSPKYKHKKTYLVTVDRPITKNQIQQLKQGIQLKAEKKPCLPAEVEQLEENKIRLIISEGKYHQVKRMMAAVDNHVIKLHREKIAHIFLDERLKAGEWRALTASEIDL